LDRKRGKNFV